jgi:uncharacterized protein (DUF1499 family)
MIDKPTAAFPVLLLMAVPMLVLSCVSQGQPAGVNDGKLAPCPGRPNCVSSEHPDGPSRIEPLTFRGTSEAAWESLRRAVQGIGGTVEREEVDFLWAVFTSTVFRFVDDMEFRMDGATQTIHVRSASRIGYWDLGANRRRVETLRKRFVQEQDRLVENSARSSP